MSAHNVTAGLRPTLGATSNRLFERLSFGLFIVALAWAPFPLGSNRPWSWSLLALLIAAVWTLWSCSVWREPQVLGQLSQGLLGPIILALVAMGWGIVQILPVMPIPWAHPVWRIAAGLIGKDVSPTISLAPWRSETELMKLATYALGFWMARVFAVKRAGAVINALIVIGALYGAYGFVLMLAEHSQFEFFYGVPLGTLLRDLSGPFVSRDNFATFEGLTALLALGRLVSEVGKELRGTQFRAQLSRALRYFFGRGAIWLLSGALAFSVVLATGSRGGNLATWSAAAVLLLMARDNRQRRGRLGLVMVSAVVVLAVLLLEMNGGPLASRLNEIAANGATDTTRALLWNDALQMIHASPLLGWGLGTYQVVYPYFATVSMHFIMDKAHNDYLELAAGWGLPAAIIWWAALIWLVSICWRASFTGRNRLFPLLGVAASVLVGIHSIFDFSLQMPAIALTYATILGVAVGQARPPGWQT